ncbi:putative transcription factor Hap3/NF-YB family [Helianthus annuus]|uniref:Histone-fold protein n=1 Tax=Helianthus annuus TaxID=4232 RepID=A0A9K3HM41_HELAN|nr:putative histone-fold protein [Helianthus annuus]KAJ0516489.1 putative transcription factor Hap3/NF-YB family [Helianthus annuus]KAJ0628988.1 putative transcription factor Hap3/NF-YB family [Helianthus annuus]KAJ0630287.1 putative transcription factor Hap3/NF-YB family [Helianthus annuus]KAJ0684492.1 putative transcription factor Hap3/NF-YB family [Helianthus annuus]
MLGVLESRKNWVSIKGIEEQTIKAEDVFKALEEIEFPEFIAPLRASLEEFKQKNAKRKSNSSKAKEAKNSKTEEEPVTENGESLENRESHENGDEDGITADMFRL